MDSEAGTMVASRRSGIETEWVFLALSAVLFIVCAALTVNWQGSMTSNGPMPDGMAMSGNMADNMAMPAEPAADVVTMPSMWVKSPGQSWLVAGGTFEAMWIVMMVAMMLPSLVPTLLAYRHEMPSASQVQLNGAT